MRLARWSIAVFAFSSLVGGSSVRPACGSPVPGSWSGASASATFWTQSQTQQGASATATAAGTDSVGYYGSMYWFAHDTTVYHADITGKFSASAGASAGQLLQVAGEAASPNPGVLGSDASGTAVAASSWSNDAVVVSNPSGGNLPSVVRLNFALTASAPIEVEWPNDSSSYAGITATYNGTALKYTASSSYYLDSPSGGIHADPGNGHAVDTSSTGRDVLANSSFVKQAFHIDLPVSKSGLSDPFSLGLQLQSVGGLVSNSAYRYSDLAANIALTGIALPDGTSLSSLGDSASLVSGLSAPAPVPEPASVALWAMAGTGAAIAAVRRTQRRS